MMECNKDEALRAKEIAEKKFEAKDFAGAKKFALKAQNLFPGLDGISQMVATMDVYLASEQKICGQSDLYSILAVHASCDEETLKKQYRKLALQLHPDKNKSVGAEGAFQLISDAWRVLSDRGQRLMYHQKINVKGPSPKPQPTKDHSTRNTATNGLFDSVNIVKPTVKPRKRPPRSRPRAPPSAASPPSAAAPPSSATPPPSTVPPPFTIPSPTAAPLHVAPTRTAGHPPSNQAGSNSFWTCCHHCKVRYEYLRAHLNITIICPRCKLPFFAVEILDPASTPTSSIPWTAVQQVLNLNQNAAGRVPSVAQGMGHSGLHNTPNLDSYNKSNFQWGQFSQSLDPASAAAPSTAAAQAASMVKEAYANVRKDREEAVAAKKKETALRRQRNAARRKAANSENPNAGVGGSVADFGQPLLTKVDRLPTRKRGFDAGPGPGGVGDEHTFKRTGSTSMDVSGSKQFNSGTPSSRRETNVGLSGDSYKSRATAKKTNILSKINQSDAKKMLIEKACTTIDNKLNEWKAAKEAKLQEEEKVKKKQKQKEKEKQKSMDTASGDATCQDTIKASRKTSEKPTDWKDTLSDDNAQADDEVIEPMSIDVPDPDFHDFDKDRSERSFTGEQIWATYDNEDGMPRYYALVQKVISRKPFKLRMSFLTTKSNNEFGPLNWVASGFSKTCGEFRIGKYEVNDTVNIFSHMVRWEKCPRGIIKIVPRKGDIWAMYKNWSPDWNEHTPDDQIYKYDMVEILEDYNEDQGVSFTPLLKVAGYKTVFLRHPDPSKVKKISREEMFRFSHQVPSVVLTGEEAHNAPKGCYELDPAATPLELLKVIEEAEEDRVIKVAEQKSVS